MIVAFPLVAGAVIAAFSYQTVFGVLVALAVALLVLSTRRSTSGALDVVRPTR
ncbi:hypothetical protein [Asanoa ferruginea]|uniref:hypothetical protein n=1 Tax=Asanoa ferruginea TaxID=53367 RepID=UPI0014772EB8|nr:hypothetical protein [Asanoa ferruginea]